MAAIRKIIHVDMDAFYASVEQRDFPEYRGRPVIVGGSPESRGVVCAASYEARKFGVHSAMPSKTAVQLCPHAVFLAPRFDVYSEVSRGIMAIFEQYSDLVEPLSLDEAYLDVTQNKKSIAYATAVAKEIRRQIFTQTALTASAGVAPNKFLAKIASDMRKPNGLTVITPEIVTQVLETLPVRKVPGIGKVTEERMKLLGIITTGDLRRKTEAELIAHFGKSGAWFYQIARGEDDRPVDPSWERKSIGAEDTFADDLIEIEVIIKELKRLTSRLFQRVENERPRTATLKLTYSDFEKITRSRTTDRAVIAEEAFLEIALELLANTEAGLRPIRLLGVSVSNFETADVANIPALGLPIQLEFPFAYQLNVEGGAGGGVRRRRNAAAVSGMF